MAKEGGLDLALFRGVLACWSNGLRAPKQAIPSLAAASVPHVQGW